VTEISLTETILAQTAEPGTVRRWAACGALVLAIHMAPAAVMLWWLAPPEAPAEPPPAAVMIDMAPLPAAPPTAPSEIPPGPQQTQTAAPPPEPDVIPLPELPPALHPDAALPPPPKRRPAVPHHLATVRQEAPPADQPPAPATTAPPAVEAPPAPTAAAPAQGAVAAVPSQGPQTWHALLLGRLEQFKRYPAIAQVRRQQGVATIRFTLDRSGNVLSSSLEKSSGFGLLDAEALALLQRAQPLPKPPADTLDDQMELIVPIEFFLHGR
jgi:periplasmic protein TonB